MNGAEIPEDFPADRPPGARNEFTARGDVGTVFQAASLTLHGSLQPAPEPLDQIPLPYPGFTNRDALLERLRAAVDELGGGEGIVVIEGPPGVGKRAVARRFAALYRDRFPGGNLHVDCADFGAPDRTGTADRHAMLADVLCALGVAREHAPSSSALLRSCYQDRMSRRPGPVLVVVENAAEPAQVTALRPHKPGSLVLVTAAPGANLTELGMQGAEFHRLGGLDETHSAAVFHRAAGRVSAASAELIRLCDGIPLALLVLARRVARLHAMTETELAERLADERELLAALVMGGRPIVSAALTAAYQALPVRLRTAYRNLGLLPGADIGPDVAAVVLAEPVETLEALADAQLLQRKPSGRYAFGNNLIRLHAREQAESEPLEHREAVLDQVLRHYLLRAAFADRAKRRDRTRVADHAELLDGLDDPFAGPEAKERALAWLDGERANLVPVVQAAHDAGFLRWAVLLADALTAYYPDRRDLSAWVTTATLGARAAAHLGDAWAEARLRSMLSRPLTDLDDLEQARAELEAAHRLAEQAGDPVLQASVWEFHGRFLDRVDRPAALDAHRRAHDLNDRAGERRGVALALNYSADTLRAMGEHERAHDSYERALELFGELHDERMAARTRIGLGLIQAQLGDPAASTTLEEAADALTGTHYEAQARVHLADLARRSGDAEAERRHLQRALDIYRDVRHPAADEVAARLLSEAPE